VLIFLNSFKVYTFLLLSKINLLDACILLFLNDEKKLPKLIKMCQSNHRSAQIALDLQRTGVGKIPGLCFGLRKFLISSRVGSLKFLNVLLFLVTWAVLVVVDSPSS